ncbi:MAG: hemerythrin domain-containing protein [Rhodanobacteraceae bacterium]
MDALKFLKAGHYQIRDLLEDLCDADVHAVQVRSDLLAQAGEALEVHFRIETEIFYPAFEHVTERDSDSRMFREALEGHRAVVELLLPDLQATYIASEQFCGRAKVLRQLVELQIRDEEAELFPRVKKLLSTADRNVLGERLLQRKQELSGESLYS